MQSLPEGTVLGGWTLGKVVGVGQFGIVQEARRPDLAGSWVMKLCPLIGVGANKIPGNKIKDSKQAVKLHKEYELYTNIFNYPRSNRLLRLPPVGATGKTEEHRFMVLPRLGFTLAQVGAPSKGQISWPVAARVAIQVLEALEYVHSKRYVYLDLNPNNVMFGVGGSPDQDDAFLVDFGLSLPYRNITGGWNPASPDGTQNYAALSSGLGLAASPRDDLESFGYLLAHMLGGIKAIPWNETASLEACREMKMYIMGVEVPSAAASASAAASKKSASSSGLFSAAAGPTPLFVAPGGTRKTLLSLIKKSASPPQPPAALAIFDAYMTHVMELAPGEAIDYEGLRGLFTEHAADSYRWGVKVGGGGGGGGKSSSTAAAAITPSTKKATALTPESRAPARISPAAATASTKVASAGHPSSSVTPHSSAKAASASAVRVSASKSAAKTGGKKKGMAEEDKEPVTMLSGGGGAPTPRMSKQQIVASLVSMQEKVGELVELLKTTDDDDDEEDEAPVGRGKGARKGAASASASAPAAKSATVRSRQGATATAASASASGVKRGRKEIVSTGGGKKSKAGNTVIVLDDDDDKEEEEEDEDDAVIVVDDDDVKPRGGKKSTATTSTTTSHAAKKSRFVETEPIASKAASRGILSSFASSSVTAAAAVVRKASPGSKSGGSPFRALEAVSNSASAASPSSEAARSPFHALQSVGSGGGKIKLKTIVTSIATKAATSPSPSKQLATAAFATAAAVAFGRASKKAAEGAKKASLVKTAASLIKAPPNLKDPTRLFF